MKVFIVIGAVVVLLAGGVAMRSGLQRPTVRDLDPSTLREYAGVYQWGPDAFLYLQMWEEFSGFGKPSLVAFDESGDVRMLYPTARDQFFTGPGIATASDIESRVAFQRDASGRLVLLTWDREGAATRTARRVDMEKIDDARFPSGTLQLAGTLISPTTAGTHPAIILVHGSGAETREHMLPFARFLVRRGFAILGYDKRGVGGSAGDWNTATFDDLASDVVAAFNYLRLRTDIDPGQIGLLGVSQAGWIMPLAAVRARDIAFLISISGAGIPGTETTIDQARNEMVAGGMATETVEQVVNLMRLQYEFARTGQGWDQYAEARAAIAARMGTPPDSFPGTATAPYWQFIRRLVFYDPAPTLRQLRLPTLAIFGELDNNIMAEKNRAAWQAALAEGRHPDYTLRILPKANHLQLEAKVGSNAEMASLQRFVPSYAPTLIEWLARHVTVSTPSRSQPDPPR